jgi:hypothetical protein
MARAAVVKGTFLRPGISKNNRAYTPKNISSAVSRMKSALDSPDGLPLTMATSHSEAASDNALATIGMITSVDQMPDGSATFEADIADTSAGRDIAALVVPDTQGRRFVKGISIRGQWASDPYEITAESGDSVITADELEVMGIDFTARPGVEGAQITDAALAESLKAVEVALADRGLIFESAPDAEFLDEANKEPYGAVVYADPGYQKDKKKRYPINTAAHVRAAWSFINQAKNGSAYSAAQLKRIKGKIKSAAKKLGVDIQGESQMLIDELTDVLEAYASVCYDNGASCINIGGYTDDAGKLAPLGARLAYAAAVALNAVDPDADGDVDLIMPDGTHDSSSSSTESAPDDDEMEDAAVGACAHCGEPVEDTAMYCPMCGQPIQQAESSDSPTNTENQEIIVPEDTTTETETEASTEAATTEAAPAIDASAIVAGVVEGMAPSFNAIAEALKALAPAPVAEAAAETAATETETSTESTTEAPATFTMEQVQEQLQKQHDKDIAEAVETFRKSGGGRKGLVPTHTVAHTAADLSEGSLDAKSLAEMSSADFFKYSASVWETQPLGRKMANSLGIA